MSSCELLFYTVSVWVYVATLDINWLSLSFLRSLLSSIYSVLFLNIFKRLYDLKWGLSCSSIYSLHTCKSLSISGSCYALNENDCFLVLIISGYFYSSSVCTSISQVSFSISIYTGTSTMATSLSSASAYIIISTGISQINRFAWIIFVSYTSWTISTA